MKQEATTRLISAASYAGGGLSVGSALTLTDVGIIFGIVTAAATFGVNWWYRHRQHVARMREHEAYMLSRAKTRPADLVD